MTAKKPAPKAPAKPKPKDAPKPKPAPKTDPEGPGDEDSVPELATYPGTIQADQGDQGRI